MPGSALKFDRNCHVLYSKACKQLIQAAIARRYPESVREAVRTKVQKQYAKYLSEWRTNLGDKDEIKPRRNIATRPVTAETAKKISAGAFPRRFLISLNYFTTTLVMCGFAPSYQYRKPCISTTSPTFSASTALYTSVSLPQR